MPKKKSEHWFLDEDGNWTRPDDFYDWLRTMQALFAGGKVKVSIDRPGRSISQLRYLFGVVYPKIQKGLRDAGRTTFQFMGPMGEVIELPLSTKVLHRWYKRVYLTPESPEKEPSTKGLDTTEMHYFIENIRHDEMVKELGIHIPQPDEPPIQAYEKEQS